MIRFLNCFEVPEGREEEFFAMWHEINGYMAAQPGYLGHWLHRSLTPQAKYRFVNYVEWETVEHWQAAHGEQFRAMVSGPEWAAFASTPALYELVHQGGAIC